MGERCANKIIFILFQRSMAKWGDDDDDDDNDVNDKIMHIPSTTMNSPEEKFENKNLKKTIWAKNMVDARGFSNA